MATHSTGNRPLRLDHDDAVPDAEGHGLRPTGGTQLPHNGDDVERCGAFRDLQTPSDFLVCEARSQKA